MDQMDTSDTEPLSQLLLLHGSMSTDIKEVAAEVKILRERTAEKGTVESQGYAVARSIEKIGKSVDNLGGILKMADDNARALWRSNHDVHERRIAQFEAHYRERDARDRSIDSALARIEGMALAMVPVVGGKPLEIKATVNPKGALVATASWTDENGKETQYALVRMDAVKSAGSFLLSHAWHIAGVVAVAAGAYAARWWHVIVHWIRSPK